MEKHCNNSQCFKEKNYKGNQLNIKKTINRDNFRKKSKKTPKKEKKNHVRNTIAIHSVL